MDSLLLALAEQEGFSKCTTLVKAGGCDSCGKCTEYATKMSYYQLLLRSAQTELAAKDAEVQRLRGLLAAGTSVSPTPGDGGGVLPGAGLCALRLCEAPTSRFPHEYAVPDGKSSQWAVAVVAATHKVILRCRLVDSDGQPVHGTHIAEGGVPFSLSLILDSSGEVVQSEEPVFEFGGSSDGAVQLAREDTVTFEFKLRYLSSRVGVQTMLRFRIKPLDEEVARRHPQLVLCTPPFKSLARRNGSRHSKSGGRRATGAKRQRSPSDDTGDDESED